MKAGGAGKLPTVSAAAAGDVEAGSFLARKLKQPYIWRYINQCSSYLPSKLCTWKGQFSILEKMNVATQLSLAVVRLEWKEGLVYFVDFF